MISIVRSVFTAASSCGRGALIATTPLRAWNPCNPKARVFDGIRFTFPTLHSFGRPAFCGFRRYARRVPRGTLARLARLPRLDLPGIPQHTVQRGNNRLSCFLDDGVRLRYPRGLQEALIAISVQCTLTFTPIRARSWRHPLNKPVVEENLFAIRNYLREQRLGLRRLPRHARSQEQKLRWRPLAPHQPRKPDK